MEHHNRHKIPNISLIKMSNNDDASDGASIDNTNNHDTSELVRVTITDPQEGSNHSSPTALQCTGSSHAPTHVGKGLVEAIDVEAIVNSLPLALQRLCKMNVPDPDDFKSEAAWHAALKAAQKTHTTLATAAGVTITDKDLRKRETLRTYDGCDQRPS